MYAHQLPDLHTHTQTSKHFKIKPWELENEYIHTQKDIELVRKRAGRTPLRRHSK